MSGLDRAFIKAYTKHQPAPGVGPIHAPMARQASGGRQAPVGSAAQQKLGQSPTSYVIYDEAHEPVSGPHWHAAPAAPPSREKAERARPTPLAVTLSTDWAGPAFEVDQFGWAAPVIDLVANGGADLDAICQKILSAARGGSQVVAVGSAEPGAGGTTLLLCLAQRLAAMKLRTALVDADFASPALAERLGMSPPFGWEDIAEHEKSICDVLIESVHDGLALLPLRGAVVQPARLAGDLYWRTTLEALKGRYRLVLLDGGRLEGDVGGPPWLRPDCGIDMAVVVGRDGNAGREALMSAVCRIQDCDIDVLGVVENFCVPEAQRLARQRPRAAAV